jgi:hypothetical protein
VPWSLWEGVMGGLGGMGAHLQALAPAFKRRRVS